MKCPFCHIMPTGARGSIVEFQCGMVMSVHCAQQLRPDEIEAYRPHQPAACIRGERDLYLRLQARLAAHVAELEAENKALRDRFSDSDTERNVAQAAMKATFDRLAELEERCKQARDDEAWANGDGLVELQPVTAGWVASTLDGVHSITATAPTIHGALRALREKVEARP